MKFALLAASATILFAAVSQTQLPAPLSDHLQTLADSGTVTVNYTVQKVGGAKAPYKLVLSKPNLFLLTTPTGTVQSDGKTVTTYTKSTNKYSETVVSEGFLNAFALQPEVVAWGAFLINKPSAQLLGALVGKQRSIGGVQVTEVNLTYKKGPQVTLFVDNEKAIARGASLKSGDKDLLVIASDVQVSKDPSPADTFAFKAPAGAEKEEVAAMKADYAGVQAILNDNCLPCHSANSARAGVVTSSYEGISAIVTAGNPSQSTLIRVLRASGRDRMPRGRAPLTEDQIKLIEAWITAGAKQ